MEYKHVCSASPFSFFARFRRNHRALVSLWLLGGMFIISLFAEMLANDKPILASYNGRLFFPVFKNYSETAFGGDFETGADYKDPFLVSRIEENGWMFWPPVRFSYSTVSRDLEAPAPAPPSRLNWLGTDDQSRDVLARAIYGFRISILFALALTFISISLGLFLGALQGFYGGKTDLALQRLTEIWDGLPMLYMLIILASIVKPDFWWLLMLLSLFSWMGIAALARGEFLRVRNFDYVRAARALGVSDTNIMFRHILPNAVVSSLTYAPFVFCGAIGALTSLDFLGFGLPPGSPSLGEMVSQGKNNLHAPWLGFTAFFTLAITLSLAMFIGEGVRDALDPRKYT